MECAVSVHQVGPELFDIVHAQDRHEAGARRLQKPPFLKWRYDPAPDDACRIRTGRTQTDGPSDVFSLKGTRPIAWNRPGSERDGTKRRGSVKGANASGDLDERGQATDTAARTARLGSNGASRAPWGDIDRKIVGGGGPRQKGWGWTPKESFPDSHRAPGTDSASVDQR
ncbi:MAG: hypothetical protein LQ340_003887 [Diploschistes diacapsis]|nr:MAG: hypothetical protein LQ340_003887 [Diploschistes diacapsis]